MMTKNGNPCGFGKVWEEQRVSIIYSLGVFVLLVVLHGADMFHFSCVGDELKESMEDIPDIYIAQRRWGIAVWKTLFGYGYLPYLNVLVFAAISTTTVLYQLKLLGFRTLFAQVIYGMAYCACPVWYSLIGISHLADVFALSMLCSTLAVYAVSQLDGWRSILFSLIFMMVAMSIYQTSVFYVATLWMTWYTGCLVRGGESSFFKSAAKLSVTVIAGWGSCFAVSCILRRSGLASLDVMHMIGNYQSYFSNGIREMLMNQHPIDVCAQLWQLMLDAVTFALGIKCVNGAVFSYSHFYYAAGGVMSLLCCLVWLKKRSAWGTASLVAIIVILCTAVLPYTTYIISAGTMTDLRMYMCTGVSVAYMWALVAERVPFDSRFGRGVVCVLGVLLLKGFYTYTESTRDVAWYAEQTKQMFFDIRAAARAVAKQENLAEYKVLWVGDDWVGRVLPVRKALDSVDKPFLTGWVQPFAVKNFAAYYGCGRMEWVWTLPDELEAHVKTMPTWPHPGSVQRWGDDIIIKVHQKESER